MADFASQFRATLRDQDLTLWWLSRQTEITTSRLSDFLHGRSAPSPNQLDLISRALKRRLENPSSLQVAFERARMNDRGYRWARGVNGDRELLAMLGPDGEVSIGVGEMQEPLELDDPLVTGATWTPDEGDDL